MQNRKKWIFRQNEGNFRDSGLKTNFFGSDFRVKGKRLRFSRLSRFVVSL